jgi:hypothetical protein
MRLAYAQEIVRNITEWGIEVVASQVCLVRDAKPSYRDDSPQLQLGAFQFNRQPIGSRP